MTTNELSILAKKLHDFSNENIEKLDEVYQLKDKTHDYYLGIIRKQAILTFDLSLILKNRDSDYISTPYIILRSLLDDYLHILYLETCADKESEIEKINASSYNEVFKSIQYLTKSNYKHFEGKFQFYLTQEQVDEVKIKFKEKNKNYLKENTEFEFKNFMPFTNMVNSIDISREVNIYKDRAFYLWKEFSEFVHFSNYSFEYEIRGSSENLNKIDESFQYIYNTICMVMKYFVDNFQIEFKNDEVLLEKYGLIK